MNNEVMQKLCRAGRTAVGTGLAAGIAWLLLSQSGAVAMGIREGLATCGTVVIPSLFPFLIFSGLLGSTELGEWLAAPLRPLCRCLFHLPPETGGAVLMGAIGGYPAGARAIASLLEAGRISHTTARRMLCFCVNAGPAFVISTIGVALYGSFSVGAGLLAAHLGASVLVGAFTAGAREEAHSPPLRRYGPLSTALVDSVSGAARSMLTICAFVAAFSGLRALLLESGALPRLCTGLQRLWPVPEGTAFYTALIRGLLEVTDGCMAAASLPRETAFVLTAFLLSFGGVSVLFQAASAFGRLPMGFGLFFFSRLANGCVAACLAYGIYRCGLLGEEAGAALVHPVMGGGAAGIVGGLALIGMCSIVLLTVVIGGISTKNEVAYGKKADEMI